MADAPSLFVLDVNETLSDLSPLPARWEAVGASGHLASRWFAEVLRDGFALAAAGDARTFAVLAEATARRLLAAGGVADVDDAVGQIMAGFAVLDVHPDVPAGLRGLRATGARVVTLSNGAATVADRLLTRAGVRDQVDEVLSVEDAGRWKPAPQAYRYALAVHGTPPAEAMLVAVHPWDVHGAVRAGLRTAWVNRTGAEYPPYFAAPELAATSLVELAQALGAPAPGPA